MSKQNNWNNVKYKSLLDYLNIIRANLVIATIIFLAIFSISLAYAFVSKDKFMAQTTLKISQPEGNILDASSFLPEMGDRGADRFIANEIETMSNISIRKLVAQVIVDSFKSIANTDNLSLFLKKKKLFSDGVDTLQNEKAIAGMLFSKVDIQQKKGLDFIEISTKSASPFEASLIVNSYARVYRQFNLLNNRKQVTRVKEFLEDEKSKKYEELLIAENEYKLYQLRGGAVQLDEQARTLIETMTELESMTNSTSIELAVTKQSLEQYKAELRKKDQSLSKHLETKASEPYLLSLQNQIAELESQRDMAVLGKRSSQKNALVQQYDNKISALKNKLRERTDIYQSSILSASPEEIKTLSQQIFEHEVKYNSLLASQNQMKSHLNTYERRFDALPERSIDLARLERQRLGNEKIYILLEEKYQEALVNEQSIDGNVLILNHAEVPEMPSEPNRIKIVLIGLVLGLVAGGGYSIVKDSFDHSIKTPEDIEDLEIKLLGWIPIIENIDTNEFIVSDENNAIATDSYKSIRTMIKKMEGEESSKTILITSSAPSEGKSVTALNMAGSFALTGKKTIIIDCDLRKPRIHTILNKNRVPGFSDYFSGKVSYNDIIQTGNLKNLSFISAGSIPKNPTEILDSKGMFSFLEKIKSEYEIIIIDSPPLFALADAIILSQIVNETLLIARADVTDSKILQKSVSQLRDIEHSSFSGVILNGFNLRQNYGSYYYKYSYSYAYSNNGVKSEKSKKVKSPS